MESLPTAQAPDKGLWLTPSEIAALGATKEATPDVRAWLADGEAVEEAVAVAQAQAPRNTSWRLRFLALAKAVLCPGPVGPRALALAIVDAAPTARNPVPPPCSGESEFYGGAAWRLFDRALRAERAGRLAITLGNDEARAHAYCIRSLVAAARELP